MFKKIVEDSTDLMCTLNGDGKIIWINNTSKEFIGLPPTELVEKPFTDFIHDEDVEVWEKSKTKAFNKEKIVRFEVRLIHQNGRKILFDCSLIWDSKETCFFCINKKKSSHTDNKVDRNKLEEKYHILFDQSPIPKYVYDLETLQIIDVNEAAIQQYGYSRDEFQSMDIKDLRPEREVPQLMKALDKYKTTSGIIRFGIFDHLKKDGSVVKMDISGQKFSLDGRPRVMVICNDVTEQQSVLKQRKLLADIRQIFSQEKELKKILEELIAHFVDAGDFQMGEVWLISRDKRYLSLTTTYPKSEFTSAFYNRSKEINQFNIGNGLPGTSWKNKRIEIWDDLDKKENFIRQKAAKDAGLKSAIGIPMIDHEEVLGVILLGSNQNVENLSQKEQYFSEVETIIGSELKRKLLEEDYNQIFKTAPDIISIIDFEGSFKRINPAGCTLLGYTEDELLNMPYSELVYPADRSKFENQIKKYSQSESLSNITHRVVTRSGEVVWLDWNLSRNSDEGLSYGVAKNVTEQNELQKLLDEVTDIARIGGWEVDLVSNTVYWSPMTRMIHEVDDDYEPVLETAINFYREDVRDDVRNYVNRAIETGETWDFELPIITARGKERWIKSIAKIEYKDGLPIRILGSFQDIHDRKMAELRLQNTADNIPGAIFQYVLYPDGSDEILNLTRGAEMLWGIPAEECMKNIDLIWNQTRAGGDYERVFESIETSVRTMEPWHCQYRSRLPSGKLLWHEGFGRPRKRSDGSILWDSLITDITDQKETENLLERASEMAKIGSWELDLRQGDTDKMYWSPMIRRIMEVEELYDPSLSSGFEFYNDESKIEIQNAVDQLINEGTGFDLELNITTAAGTEKWVRCIGEAEGINGKTVKIFGSLQDITKRKAAELAVQETLEERNTILESISDAFFAVDREWKVTYWNREAENILGTKSSEIVGKNLWDIYSDAVELKFYTNYHKAIETGRSVTFEEYYPTLEKWFEVSAYPSENGLSVYFKDVTLRKITSEAVRQSNERFLIVAKATNDAIYDWDIEKNELFLGDGFHQLFGHDLKDKYHSMDNFANYLHPDESDEILESLQSILENDREPNFLMEYRHLKSDGTYAYVINRGTVVRDESGNAKRLVGAVTDITQRRNYEESLQRLNENLEQHSKELAISNRELEQFAFVTSHDLQEPLRMVTSFLTQLERKYGDLLDEKAHQYIHFAVDGAQRMRQIILDLLEFSTVGKSVDIKETVDVGEIVDEVCLLLRKAIEDSSAVVVKENLPVIIAQRAVLGQIFQNLIGNAIKYRKMKTSPKIIVSAAESKDHWTFSVKDNGIGIDPEYFEKIFIIFQKLHTKEEYAGSGMGLSIVKKIIENLGGEIWVDSIPGEGSNFQFTLKK